MHYEREKKKRMLTRIKVGASDLGHPVIEGPHQHLKLFKIVLVRASFVAMLHQCLYMLYDWMRTWM